MDGNGRWARQRGLPRAMGHSAGIKNLRAVVELAADRGLGVLTCYAFSAENWRRPAREVRTLMALMEETLDRELSAFHRIGLRLRFIGRWGTLPQPLPRRIQEAQDLTSGNLGMVVCLAVNYGGRQEILDGMVRALAAGEDPAKLGEEDLGRYLDTAGLPDPDMIVRTAGEVRLSNFLLWQGAYAEYWATPVLWPDFGAAELDAALAAYAQRTRKFGGLSAKG
jgi:undecaprenyl diphosphate synthase